MTRSARAFHERLEPTEAQLKLRLPDLFDMQALRKHFATFGDDNQCYLYPLADNLRGTWNIYTDSAGLHIHKVPHAKSKGVFTICGVRKLIRKCLTAAGAELYAATRKSVN